jgi:hypothetical protein
MKKKLTNGLILIFILSILISCSTNPTAKIQGVYEVNKDSLKSLLQKEIGANSTLTKGLLNVAINNAVIEFNIKSDSITGIIFMAGETTLLNSPIIVRNDSLLVKTDNNKVCLIPTKSGLLYKNIGSKMYFVLNKTERTELSQKTQKAIQAQKKAIQEKKEFEKNLGKWKVGNYVDEFGDKTGEGFAYCLIRGTSENSIDNGSDIYVKAIVEDKKINFQIYNSSLSMKETFPEEKFGIMKLKFPDGSIKSEKIFFYKNSAYESGQKPILYNYISQNNGIVKVYIDLSTASDYLSDKYHFEIEKNNLPEILNKLKK